MRAPIVEPTGIVEFVGSVFVVTHVAAVFVFGAIVAWPGSTDHDKTIAIRRPLKAVHAILETSEAPRLPAIHRKQVDLRAWRFCWRARCSCSCCLACWSGRKECQ